MFRKRMLVVCLFSVMALLLSACGLKETISDKISEGLTEKILEAGSDGKVDVDIDGDDFSFTTEDGESTTYTSDEDGATIESGDGSVMTSGENVKWPTDKAAVYIPEMKDGKLSYSFNSDESCILMLDEVTQEGYDDYKQKIIDAGYTEEATDATAEDLAMYYGTNDKGIVAGIGYTPSSLYLQITVDTTGKAE